MSGLIRLIALLGGALGIGVIFYVFVLKGDLSGLLVGAPSGPSMHIVIEDYLDARLGDPNLFGTTGVTTDKLEGDLVEGSDGVWRGTLRGSTDGSSSTVVMTVNCEERITGTQQLEVEGTKVTVGDSNFLIEMHPKSAPTYSSAGSSCGGSSAEKDTNGIEWLKFGNPSYRENSLYLNLKDPPGGTTTEEVGLKPATGEPTLEDCTFVLKDIGECYRKITVTVSYKE